MAITLQTGIRSISGIGESRAKALARLNIFTVEDLLYHFPRAYEYRGNVKTLIAAQDGEIASFILTLASAPTVARGKNNITYMKFLTYDDTAKCTITIFNQSYLKSTYKAGQTYRAYGKIVRFGRQIEMVNPTLELITPNNELLPLFPVYPATEDMSGKQIFHLTETVLSYIEENGKEQIIEENLPADTVESEKLISRYEAIRRLHRPEGFSSLNEAKRRMMYEELYFFACDMYKRKQQAKIGTAPDISGCDMSDFKNALTFELTDAQRRTLNEIYSDMTSPKHLPMQRLVSGDVGSGKTICAAGAAFISARSGFQTALLVPTEILARQHYNELHKFFAPIGINVSLLVGNMTKSEKAKTYEGIRSGNSHIVVGTHALLTDKIAFDRLGLVICDEQHRFGVNQRELLLKKGDGVHMLVMSATPIPRTLAMVMFGDLDVSVIDQLPPGRKNVSTYVVDEDYRARINEFIRKEIAIDHQVYVVCPAVEESDNGEIPISVSHSPEKIREYKESLSLRKSAVAYAEQLQKDVFPDRKVACIHGKMKSEEKSRIMEGFELGKIDVLVSTTVIEVGVNVPNATLMIIENAECFGLSQLHQLRGRVGRSSKKSFCILVSASRSATALKRLEIMKDTSNGFKIAEQDLKMRGPGDFIKNETGAIRQHGKLKLTLCAGLDDTKLLYSAFKAAENHIIGTKNAFKSVERTQ